MHLLAPPPFLRLEELFGNNHPIEVDIGCGKGKFLAERAAELPTVNLLAIERSKKWTARAQKRCQARAVTNVHFLLGDAVDILRYLIPPSTIRIFHIYFPDPWPKTRHHKRRFITHETLALLHGCLEPGGLVEIATDDGPYFEAIRAAVDRTAPLWPAATERRNGRFLGGHRHKTHYELKYEAQGRMLYYLELKKAGRADSELFSACGFASSG